MNYNLTREEIIQLAHMIFDQSVNSYLDLKESTCERLVSTFLLDKKTFHSNTHLNFSNGSIIAGASYQSEILTLTESLTINTN